MKTSEQITAVDLIADDEKALYNPFNPESEFSESVKLYILSKAAVNRYSKGIKLKVFSREPLDEEKFRAAASNWIEGEKAAFRVKEKHTICQLLGLLIFGSIALVLSLALTNYNEVIKYSLLPIMASPALVMQQGNELILRHNSQGMFVTAWIGILEISTGKILMANAGHEYPVIIHPDGQTELIKEGHGFVLGGMEGMKYREYEMRLQPGSKLFLYTDGLTEATSAEKELFGTDRMIAAAGSAGGASPGQVLDIITQEVNEFVGDNEQFDDLTMLCVEYRG